MFENVGETFAVLMLVLAVYMLVQPRTGVCFHLAYLSFIISS